MLPAHEPQSPDSQVTAYESSFSRGFLILDTGASQMNVLRCQGLTDVCRHQEASLQNHPVCSNGGYWRTACLGVDEIQAGPITYYI